MLFKRKNFLLEKVQDQNKGKKSNYIKRKEKKRKENPLPRLLSSTVIFVKKYFGVETAKTVLTAVNSRQTNLYI
jgi:predicted phosphoribosyltransferase